MSGTGYEMKSDVLAAVRFELTHNVVWLTVLRQDYRYHAMTGDRTPFKWDMSYYALRILLVCICGQLNVV